MAKKKTIVRKKSNRKDYHLDKRVGKFGREVEEFDEEVDKEVQEVEKWMFERRKFLIKLAWVVGAITVLLLILKFWF